MAASLLDALRAGPPPPKVAILPDGLFFTRALPVTVGATPAEAAAQVELALEAVSPFPLAQLYYGYYWTPGADHAFVFAAYRRRFTTDQAAAWAGAELVMPAFASLFGARVEPATTIVLASPEGLTAVHWAAGPVPTAVHFRPFPPAPTEETEEALAQAAAQRARVREELLRACDGSKHVIDLAAPPAADPAHSDRETVFRAGDFVSRLPASATLALDVRDKGELAALRSARKRDVLLWRVALGCAAGFLLLAAGEVALVGGKQWLGVRKLQQTRQQPLVEKIMTSQELAHRIDELATKRLLPFEMLTIASEKKPSDITFTRAYTRPEKGIYTLFIDGKTTNSAQMGLYQSQLKQVPACENVDLINQQEHAGTTTFTLVVTFKPDAVKPAPPS
jgi:hypothetical protein